MKTTITCIGIALHLLLFFSISSCSKNNSDNVAKLLDRNPQIAAGKEWDHVQNLYVELRNKINKAKDDKSAVDSKIKLAQLFIQEARVTGEHGHYYPAALTLTKEILATPTITPDVKFTALVTKAGIQLSLHDFTNALNTAKEAIKINAYNAQLYGVLVDANVELGNYKEAISFADKMMAIRPDLRSYSRVAYLREINGDVEGAKKAFTMAIEAGYPGYEETAWAMHTYGELLLRYDNVDQASQVYQTILQERENYPFAIAAQADIAIKKNDLAGAEKLLNQAIKIIPEVSYYITLAEIYKEQNRSAELTKITSEILTMLKDDEAAGHNMNLEYAHVYLELMDDSATAEKYATIELSKRPKNIDVNRMLALINSKSNDSTEAFKFYQAAKTTKSVHPELKTIEKYLSQNKMLLTSI
jgi:tetratricopeptide (TPR) repeat protein